MSRRVIEEEVRTTPVDSTTYVEDDASWAGRTIALIVLVALLIVGAIWLVNYVGNDNDGGPSINQPNNEGPAVPGDNTDTNNTDTNNNGTDTGTNYTGG